MRRFQKSLFRDPRTARPTAECPGCGRVRRHKTLREAYTTPDGLGLMDLIPGVRDLPWLVRLLIVFADVMVVVYWLSRIG
jgi:hypothetical protein